MIKKKICYVIIALVLFSTITSIATTENNNINASSFEPPLIEWEKTFGSQKIDYGNCVEQTSDDGYIFTGAIGRNAFSPWLGNVYLVKTNSLGDEEWNKTYGIYPNENVGRTVIYTSDDGYLITGYTGYTYHIDGYVIKTDFEGGLIWDNTYGNYDIDHYDSLQCGSETKDGSYIFTGITNTMGAGGGDAWLLETDSDGNELWVKAYGGSLLDSGYYVIQTIDDGFIIVGSTNSYSNNEFSDIWVIKTDENGNKQWNKNYGGVENDEGYSIQQTTDGGYIITGFTYLSGAGNGDVYILKINSDGNEQWNKTFGGTEMDIGYCVKQTKDGGFFITGQYTDPIYQVTDLYVIKTDNNGNEEWSQIIDNNQKEDVGNYGIETNDKGYIVIGNTGIYQEESTDVYLLKFEGKENQPPNAPFISGESSGKPGTAYDYKFNALDPDDDQVKYIIDWGDGKTDTTDLNPSGVDATVTHTWNEKGEYTIKVHAQDQFGLDGPESTKKVTMPRNRIVNWNYLLIKVLERFPLLERILNLQ